VNLPTQGQSGHDHFKFFEKGACTGGLSQLVALSPLPTHHVLPQTFFQAGDIGREVTVVMVVEDFPIPQPTRGSG